ncbi:MAG: hypothetical protein BAJATHORv1_10032 [Candidatus Thorarchaeota archaeon]|nr:MAG: hypothetical protein BAJATHORv1_10032 [Candidatus Thorarchaeota archaeon]
MSEKIRVCPRCGSTQVEIVRSTTMTASNPINYRCKATDCGYLGTVCAELDADDLERFQLAIKQASTQ